MAKEINMFVIYAREDKEVKLDLLRHLYQFEEAFNLSIWHDDQIEPGQLWKPHIESRLNFTDIFLLLVSVDFMNSQFIKQTEFKTAIDRHKENKSVVIPVIINYCQWDIDFTLIDYKFNINELQVLPDEGKSVGEWNTPDQAYNNIAAGVRRVLTSIQNKNNQESKKEKEITKIKAEEDKRLKEAAEAKQLEEEKAAKIKAEEDKRLKDEIEAKRLADEKAANIKAEEDKRLKEEAEAKRKADEAKRLADEEAANIKAEEDKRLKEDAEAKRKADEAKRLADEEAAKIKAAEDKRLKEDAEAKRKADEAKRLADEEAALIKAEKDKRQKEEADKKKTKDIQPIKKKNKLVLPGIIGVVLVTVTIVIISMLKPKPDPDPIPTNPIVEIDSTNIKDSLAWDNAKVQNEISVYKAYLNDFPNGKYIELANDKIEILKIEQEEAAFANLKVGDLYLDGKSIVIEIYHETKTGKIVSPSDSDKMPWKEAMGIDQKLGEGWRLPTLDELKLMYKTIGQGANNSGLFKDDLYWSSTSYNSNEARLLRFRDNNTSFHYSKDNPSRLYLVRAIKDFSR